MSDTALSKLKNCFELYVDKPTQQGQDTLMNSAAIYRDEWIELMASRGTTHKITPQKKEAPTRYKKILSISGKQPDGTELTLALQSRTKTQTEKTWHVVSWRSRLSPGGPNRRFYFSDNNTWSIDANLALQMLDELESKGGLDEKYDDITRRPDFKILVNEGMSEEKQISLLEEVTMPEEVWGKNPKLVVLNDPSPDDQWRKILIVNRETGNATFRSTTKSADYMPRKNLRDDSEWFLDNSMQDANVQQAREFLRQLRSIVPNLNSN